MRRRRARPIRARAMVNRIVAERGYIKLTAPVVARYLNQARVGLCLSADEGAMFASIEYLFCGLPVVSTAGLGGREFFFDPDFTIVVDENPAAIAAAVAELIRRAPRPAEVRERTLWAVRREREKLAAFVAAIFAEAGTTPQFDMPWARLLAESVFSTTSIDALLAFPA